MSVGFGGFGGVWASKCSGPSLLILCGFLLLFWFFWAEAFKKS